MPASAAEQLLSHYDGNARALPWRSRAGDGEADPYRVWLSEVMLQQTTVAAVKPRFRRFVERWPTVEALASAPEAEVLGEWAGLGYYARARNLIACARTVAALGGFPRTEAELRRLPGVGAYTAAAVAAIAFGEPVVPVDTNVTRVMARFHGLETRPDASGRTIGALAAKMMPADRPGDFAQALMDLGATICRPRAPLCHACPLAGGCRARASGNPEAFPPPRPGRPRPHLQGVAWWTQRNDSIWLVRRPARGMLGGMAALPGPDWGEEAPAGTAIATIRHGFTHFTLDLHVHARAEADGEGWWQPLDKLADAGLPTLYRKAAEAMIDRKDALAL